MTIKTKTIDTVMNNKLTDRCGIGSEWNQMEYEIQEVIKDEWRLIIKEILDERV